MARPASEIIDDLADRAIRLVVELSQEISMTPGQFCAAVQMAFAMVCDAAIAVLIENGHADFALGMASYMTALSGAF